MMLFRQGIFSLSGVSGSSGLFDLSCWSGLFGFVQQDQQDKPPNQMNLRVEQAGNGVLYGTVENPTWMRCGEEPRRNHLELRRNPGRTSPNHAFGVQIVNTLNAHETIDSAGFQPDPLPICRTLVKGPIT